MDVRAVLSLSFLVVLIVSVNAGCSTKPLNTVTTDSSQGTFVYSWTGHSELLPDPVGVVKKNCLHSIFDPQNDNKFCSLYNQYMNATTPAQKSSLNDQLRNNLNTGVMGGYGFYFAATPFISSGYGNYLIVAQVPPKKQFSYYLGNDPAKTVQTIFTNTDATLYSWSLASNHKWVMVLRDYHGLAWADGSLKLDVVDFTVPLVEFVSHRAPATWAPNTFFQTYRDIFKLNPPTVKVLSGGHDVSDNDLMTIIAWEWSNSANGTRAATSKFGTYSSYIANALNSGSWSSAWSQLTGTLEYANYLKAGTGSSIAANDFTGLKAAVIKQYRARGGAAVVTNYYTGINKLNSQSPNINSWFR